MRAHAFSWRNSYLLLLPSLLPPLLAVAGCRCDAKCNPFSSGFPPQVSTLEQLTELTEFTKSIFPRATFTFTRY